MKLNDKELNYILSECVKSVMSEAAPIGLNRQGRKNQVYNTKINVDKPNVGTNDFDETYRDFTDDEGYQVQNKVTKNIKGKDILRQVGKAAAWTVGGMALGAFVGGVLGGDVGGLVANLGMYGGALAAFQGAIGSFRRYIYLKNMTIPNDPQIAKQMAILAAAERIGLQPKCHILQKNLTNAIDGFNNKFKQVNYEPLSWETLKPFLIKSSHTFSFMKNLNINDAEVNFDTNFMNKNVTESKLFENDYSTQEYKNFNFDGKTKEEALTEVITIGELYCETYKLWYIWTRYIQVLIDSHPDDLSWDDIIKEAGKHQPNVLFNKLYHFIFPRISQLTDAIKDKKEKKDVTIFEIVDVNYIDTLHNGTQVAYILFRGDDGDYYALKTPKNAKVKNGMRFKVRAIEKYLTGSYLKSDNTIDGEIAVFKNTILQYAIKIN